MANVVRLCVGIYFLLSSSLSLQATIINKKVNLSAITLSPDNTEFAFDVDDVLVYRSSPVKIVKHINVITSYPHKREVFFASLWCLSNLPSIFKYVKKFNEIKMLEWLGSKQPLFAHPDIIHKMKHIMYEAEQLPTCSIVQDLYRQGYSISIATNQSTETFNFLKAQGKVPNIAYKIIMTSDHPRNIQEDHYSKKPHADYYHNLALEVELSTAQKKVCIFIDDKLKNVEAAAECGFIGIYFESAEQLIQDLRELGIVCDTTDLRVPVYKKNILKSILSYLTVR